MRDRDLSAIESRIIRLRRQYHEILMEKYVTCCNMGRKNEPNPDILIRRLKLLHVKEVNLINEAMSAFFWVDEQ